MIVKGSVSIFNEDGKEITTILLRNNNSIQWDFVKEEFERDKSHLATMSIEYLKKVISELELQSSKFDFEPKSICEGCNQMASHVSRKGHTSICDWVWGRRGWRQLGVYYG